mmetsp:Transcript_70018/g.221904  ORF Transcript_70018/g.221904 Transcript_70018/m.221904 type:complete len:280 (-) Transcript_70018:896-1735(-)
MLTDAVVQPLHEVLEEPPLHVVLLLRGRRHDVLKPAGREQRPLDQSPKCGLSVLLLLGGLGGRGLNPSLLAVLIAGDHVHVPVHVLPDLDSCPLILAEAPHRGRNDLQHLVGIQPAPVRPEHPVVLDYASDQVPERHVVVLGHSCEVKHSKRHSVLREGILQLDVDVPQPRPGHLRCRCASRCASHSHGGPKPVIARLRHAAKHQHQAEFTGGHPFFESGVQRDIKLVLQGREGFLHLLDGPIIPICQGGTELVRLKISSPGRRRSSEVGGGHGAAPCW